MLKRVNKITAFLVAAASIMSVVPAMADTTTSRLESKDGTIENAVAYQNGEYVYQGYKSNDDTDTIYYNDGNKDKELDDVSDATLNTAYEDKYAFANDGSDQYLIDLTNGSVNDDSTPEDDIDTAATKLQTRLRKSDRYGDNIGDSTSNLTNGSLSATDLESGQTIEDNGVYAIPGSKFGDTWYPYSVMTASSDSQKYLANRTAYNSTYAGYLYGFTDASGKYIDASYTANIYAYSTLEGKTVKIENYSNSYDDADSDSGLLATLIQQPVALTQDKDYIYALVTVAITDTAANSRITNTAETTSTTQASVYVSDATNTDGTAKSGTTTIRTYVQKISKAQGDQQDGAYLPKTVESYEVGNVGGAEYNCSDAQNAYNAIGTTAGVADLTKITQSDVINTVSNNGIVRPKFTVNDGNLIAIETSSDSIDAFTLNFKKDKVRFLTYPGYKTDALPATTTAATANFDTSDKVDTYFVEKDSDDSVDLNDNSNTEYTESYDIDVDGNVWIVADGKIYKYENGDMTKIYACDSSLDSISVYDANNLVAWENNGDIYTTVNEGSAETEAPTAATTVTTTAKVGWSQLADGTWNFYDATGTKVVNNWANVGGVWYYLKADGVMATGWVNNNGTWYFMASSGAMKTGWINDNGTWYYLQYIWCYANWLGK